MPKVLIVKHTYYQWSLKAKLFCHKTIERNFAMCQDFLLNMEYKFNNCDAYIFEIHEIYQIFDHYTNVSK